MSNMHGNDDSMQLYEDRLRNEIDGAWDEVRRALEDSRDTRDGGGRDVSHPSHYMSDGIECIDAMYQLSPELAIYFAVGSTLKYLDRAGLKDDEGQDLLKARECWHMAKRLIRRHEDDSDI